MSLYEHFDKAALQSAQMQVVNLRLQRRIHELVATSVAWTLQFFCVCECARVCTQKARGL
jgi:hypothetical protein